MRCIHPSSPPRRGFTLIELLIVMAIIAVLIAITIPAVTKARESSNRTQCANNLRQMGIACISHTQQYQYFPTAGVNDLAAPSYNPPPPTGTGQPNVGWKQDAGWGFQILPFIDAEPLWMGGNNTTSTAQMTAAISKPLKIFFCPSRRPASTAQYTNAGTSSSTPPGPFPGTYQTAYTAVEGTAFTVALCDYAGCNGGWTTTAALNSGVFRTQASGRATVLPTDITDGLSTTLLIAEKAANPRLTLGACGGSITNEDDLGYFSGYSSKNFNTIRFATSLLLPIRDYEVTGPTGGAFGSAHAGTWNAVMADGSVRALSYNIDPTLVFPALGTTKGNEIVSDADLDP
jgi:prepilin-type N-terminal cleavage/methylation domain-containing protein